MAIYTRRTYLVIRHPLSQKAPSRLFEHLDGDLNATVALHTFHPAVNRGSSRGSPLAIGSRIGSLIREVPEEALKVARHEDVHRRTPRRPHAAITRRFPVLLVGLGSSSSTRQSRIGPLVPPAAPEPGEDVVRVRRDDELAHGEAHALRVVAREDVAEVARRDYELELGTFGVRDLVADVEVGEEIVDRLGEDARPVDRVDRAEVVLFVEGLVREQRLHDVLNGHVLPL